MIYVRIVVGAPVLYLRGLDDFSKNSYAYAMPEKYFSDQLENEEVLMVFRKHPLVLRKGLILGMICLLLGTIPSLIKPEYRYFFEGVGIGLLAGLILFAPYWVSWYYSVFIV